MLADDGPQQVFSNEPEKDCMHFLAFKQTHIYVYCPNLSEGILRAESGEFEVHPFLENLPPVSQFFGDGQFVLLECEILCLQCALRERTGEILKTVSNSLQDDSLMQKMAMRIEQQELLLHVFRTAKQLSFRAIQTRKIVPVDLHKIHV